MRDLAARLQCDPSNVTFLADRLEERGLAAGLAVRIRIVQSAATSSLLAHLSPADQQRLSRLLGKCLQPEQPA